MPNLNSFYQKLTTARPATDVNQDGQSGLNKDHFALIQEHLFFAEIIFPRPTNLLGKFSGAAIPFSGFGPFERDINQQSSAISFDIETNTIPLMIRSVSLPNASVNPSEPCPSARLTCAGHDCQHLKALCQPPRRLAFGVCACGRHNRVTTGNIPLEADLEDLLHQFLDPWGVGSLLASGGSEVGLGLEHFCKRHFCLFERTCGTSRTWILSPSTSPWGLGVYG